MGLPVVYRRKVGRDLAGGYAWYNGQRDGLGEEFLAAIDAAFDTTGLRKTVDFSRWLDGPVFEPLRNRSEFRKFFVAGGTVCWPNGADIAPETLFAVRGVSERVA